MQVAPSKAHCGARVAARQYVENRLRNSGTSRSHQIPADTKTRVRTLTLNSFSGTNGVPRAFADVLCPAPMLGLRRMLYYVRWKEGMKISLVAFGKSWVWNVEMSNQLECCARRILKYKGSVSVELEGMSVLGL